MTVHKIYMLSRHKIFCTPKKFVNWRHCIRLQLASPGLFSSNRFVSSGFTLSVEHERCNRGMQYWLTDSYNFELFNDAGHTYTHTHTHTHIHTHTHTHRSWLYNIKMFLNYIRHPPSNKHHPTINNNKHHITPPNITKFHPAHPSSRWIYKVNRFLVNT